MGNDLADALARAFRTAQALSKQPLTDRERSEIQRRVDAATPGPWYETDGALFWQLFGGPMGVYQILKAPKDGTPFAEYWPAPADAALLAHAWEDLTRLLVTLRTCEATIAQLQEQIEVLEAGEVLGDQLVAHRNVTIGRLQAALVSVSHILQQARGGNPAFAVAAARGVLMTSLDLDRLDMAYLEAQEADADALAGEVHDLRALVDRLLLADPWIPGPYPGSKRCQWCNAVDYLGHAAPHQSHRNGCAWLDARQAPAAARKDASAR